MPTRTWVVGEEVLAADFNAYVQKQVVSTFANAAARDAAIPAPAPGMVAYLNDTGQLQVYTDKAAPPGWHRPWQGSWGYTSAGSIPDITLVAGPQFLISNININFPGRMLHVMCDANVQQLGAQGNVTLQFQQGAALGLPGTWSLDPAYSVHASLQAFYPGGPTALALIGQTSAGTAAFSWGRYYVIDVGPA